MDYKILIGIKTFSSENFCIETTGPNISSWQSCISGVTPVRMVGLENRKKVKRIFGRVFVISNALDLALSNVQLRRMVTGQEIFSGSLLLCCLCKMSEMDDVYVSLEVEVSH